MTEWLWVLSVPVVLVGAVAARIFWVLFKRRRKAPRKDIYPMW